jgi:hypothetical protein
LTLALICWRRVRVRARRRRRREDWRKDAMVWGLGFWIKGSSRLD